MPVHQFTGGKGSNPLPDPLHRGRPQVINRSIRTDTGQLLRGATMDIRKQATPPCTRQAVWDHYRSLGLNLVRLGVKTDHDDAGRPLAQQLPFLDAAVECAWNARMYVMILVSINPGGYNLAQLTEFWTAVAARYASRTHVLYEITNEPVGGGGYWGQTSHWTTAKLRELRGVYDIMRAGAPDTHIMMFSSPNLYPNAASWRAVPQQFAALGGAIDWDKTSISFHYYPGTYLFGDPNGFGGLQQLKDYGYCLFMSECNDFIGDPPSEDPRNSQQIWLWLEQAEVSWVCLDGKGGNVLTQIEPKILPYLAANGRALPVE